VHPWPPWHHPAGERPGCATLTTPQHSITHPDTDKEPAGFMNEIESDQVNRNSGRIGVEARERRGVACEGDSDIGWGAYLWVGRGSGLVVQQDGSSKNKESLLPAASSVLCHDSITQCIRGHKGMRHCEQATTHAHNTAAHGTRRQTGRTTPSGAWGVQ